MTIMENLENTEQYKEEKKLSAVPLSRDNTVKIFLYFLSVFVYAIYMYECEHVIVCAHNNNIEIILTI